MEKDADDFDDMSYALLRAHAKQYGVKANLKADTLRRELKRASMVGLSGENDDDDDDDERSMHISSLPMKTPANVTRRKGSRARRSVEVSIASTSSVSRRRSSFGNGKLGVADKTLADPLAEGRIEEEEDEEEEGEGGEKEKDAEPTKEVEKFLSEDEDEDIPTRSSKQAPGDDVSAYMSEEDEGEDLMDGKENDLHAADDHQNMDDQSTINNQPTINDQLRLERQRTFEMESPSTDSRPPLARQRTFEMESPTLDSPRPPLARQRTFELESSASPAGGHTNVADAVTTGETSDTSPSLASGGTPPVEFSIIQDETSGLSAEELKARIMASIAVTPSALAAEVGTSASSSKSGVSFADQPQGKSCTKDWKKIHSTNDNRMESLVDFYQRKRKRADEAQKSAQKSAKLSAAKRAASAASLKDASAPAKSARALAFSSRSATSINEGTALKSAVIEEKASSKETAAATSTKSTMASLKASAKLASIAYGKSVSKAITAPSARAPVTKRARETAESTLKEVPIAKRARTATATASTRSAGSTEKEVPAAERPRVATNSTPNIDKRSSNIASKLPKSTTPKRVHEKALATKAVASKSVATKAVASKVVASTSAASGTSSFAFKPSVFSTKDMNLNFGAAKTEIKPPAVYPVMKKVAGGASGAKIAATAVTNSATKGSSLLPSLPKFDSQRRVSPRVNKTLDASATAKSNQSTPLSRLAPSRTTTPGKKSAVGTPASATSKRRGTPQQNGNTPTTQKSPWIPAGIAPPNCNFGAGIGNAENVFKFTAVGASTAAPGQQQPPRQPARKKFDLKESLKQKLKYKPHQGPLRNFEDDKGGKKPFR